MAKTPSTTNRTPEQKLALIMEYLGNSLASFQMDPAASPFQRGFEEAMKEAEKYARSL